MTAENAPQLSPQPGKGSTAFRDQKGGLKNLRLQKELALSYPSSQSKWPPSFVLSLVGAGGRYCSPKNHLKALKEQQNLSLILFFVIEGLTLTPIFVCIISEYLNLLLKKNLDKDNH